MASYSTTADPERYRPKRSLRLPKVSASKTIQTRLCRLSPERRARHITDTRAHQARHLWHFSKFPAPLPTNIRSEYYSRARYQELLGGSSVSRFLNRCVRHSRNKTPSYSTTAGYPFHSTSIPSHTRSLPTMPSTKSANPSLFFPKRAGISHSPVAKRF